MRPVSVLLAAVLLGSLGACGGHAHTNGHFRKLTRPPEALTGVCWPLPSKARFDFPQVLRQDEFYSDLAGHRRRRLVFQFDAPQGTVARDVRHGLLAAGFRPAPRPPGTTDPSFSWFRKSGYGSAGFTVKPVPGLGAGAPVRGYLALDLPPRSFTEAARASCEEPKHRGLRNPAEDPWLSL